MELSSNRVGDWSVLTLSGEIDLHHSARLKDEIISSLDAGGGVLLDMTEVSYIDSSGVASLVQGLTHARGKGATLGLVQPCEAVLRILRLTRLQELFAQFDSVDAAVGG